MSSASVAHNLSDKPRTGDVLISENVNFDGLLLSEPILKGLKAAGFERPSPIQLKAIPLGRCGLDLIVQAKSGTGKTCVFSVIALEGLQLDTSALQVLVLAPTREIAIQIWDVIKSIGQALSQLKCHTFIGGMPLQEDKQKLKKCHIAVGTPGRIKQLIEQGLMNIENIRMFILDEADKLLEDSFQEQINWIYSTLPDNKQMLALSATYPEYLAQHLTAYMRNPTFLRLNVSDPALLGIKQYYKSVKFHPLPNKLFESKVEVVTTILSSVDFQQCLVFSNLQTMAQNMADALNSKGWPTACIAGSLDQKDRNLAMSKLKTFKCRVLISTDLTSRGIDADKVNLVINLDIPKDHETYLHRIGRAGRFGTFGACISVASEGQEMVNLQSVEKKCNTCITLLPDQIPVDLVKTQGTINLDDMVSTEKIFTSVENGHSTKFHCNQTVSSAESPALVKSDVNHDIVNRDQGVTSGKQTVFTNEELSSVKPVKAENQKDSITADKNQGQGPKQSDDLIVDKLKQLSVNGQSSQREALSDVEVGKVNQSTDNSSKAEETSADKQLEENERTDNTAKIKQRPKKHSTGSFWTQLILERNDDEEFVQEFQARQKEDDIFDIYTELGNESPDMIAEEMEPLKHKVAKRRNESKKKIDSNITATEELTKSKDLLSSLQKMNSIKVKIPLLKETIGLKRLESPHTYETAKENLLSYTDTAMLSEKIEQVKLSENDQMPSINIGKTVRYDKDVLQKLKEILALSPLHAQGKLKLDVTCRKNDENTAIDQNNDSRSRKPIKVRRNKQNKSDRNIKMNLSNQEQEVADIKQYSEKQISSIPYDISDHLGSHEKENLEPYSLVERVVRPKEKVNSNKGQKNESMKRSATKIHVSNEQLFDDYSKNYGHKVKDNVISSPSESESSDSSESSDYSEYDNERYNQRYSKSNYSHYAGSSKNREKHDSKYSQYPKYHHSREQTHDSYPRDSNRTVETDSDAESECPTDPWEFYRQNQYYPSHQFGYQYCYPPNPFMNTHQFPYMNGYNPYSFYNPWQYPYYQMPQPSGLSYQTLYKNLQNQQKYIKMMLKSFRKMMSRD